MSNWSEGSEDHVMRIELTITRGTVEPPMAGPQLSYTVTFDNDQANVFGPYRLPSMTGTDFLNIPDVIINAIRKEYSSAVAPPSE